ncbi:MAG: hypothetical protein M1569_03265 [Candidatus Marsarchaeota archaeon]|nr:hypothetical protein [Candidatus Marsarchaeota archaeon]MCL5413395.1 hypothetical protein [Candidatus Marsarchaeota archaeon]
MSILIMHKGRYDLTSARRAFTDIGVMRSQLLKVAASEDHAVIAHNGVMRGFYRSKKGYGWIEDGVSVRESLVLCTCAVITAGTKVPEDATSVYGGTYGNTYTYSVYE